MIYKLPRNYIVDINNIPDTFDEDIRKKFEEYTEGTADDYKFQDKLCFLDRVIHSFHGKKDGSDAIMDYMKKVFEYEVKENGVFPDETDYYSIEFMEECYNLGKESQKMYSHDFSDNRHDEEKVEKLIIRIIKVLFCEED